MDGVQRALAKTPTDWQLVAIRELWPDTPIKDIAKRVNVAYRALARWRDEGLLGELPTRHVAPGGFRGTPLNPDRRGTTPKVTSAPLTAEPLCATRECDRCKFELVCLERNRGIEYKDDSGQEQCVSVWACCEMPSEGHMQQVLEAIWLSRRNGKA